MLDDLWVVFDGAQPDSAVIGLAESLEAVIRVIKTKGQFVTDPKLVVSDGACQINGLFRPYYVASNDYHASLWLAVKHEVYT